MDQAARKATNVATSFDDSIERIATAYDDLGRVSTDDLQERLEALEAQMAPQQKREAA